MVTELSVEVTKPEVTPVFLPSLWCGSSSVIAPLDDLIKVDSQDQSPEGLMQP